MLDTNSSAHNCDKEDEISLGAGLLITTTTTSSAHKYGRFWRRSLWVGIFISLKNSRTVPPQSDHVIDIHSYNEIEEVDGHSGTSSLHSNHGKFEVDEHQALQDVIAQILMKRDLDSLQKFGGVEQVASALRCNLVNGLEGVQASQAWSTNSPLHAKGFIYYFLQACNKSTILLLLISAGLSFGVEMMEQGPQYGWHDGVAILVAVLMLVSFPSIANFHRSRKLHKMLLKKKNELQVKVVRSGEHRLITISELVVGDLVHLEKGRVVPADGLFVTGDALVLDEPLNSKVDCKNPFLSSGAKVTEGSGVMLVVSVGANTTLGKVLSLVIQDPEKMTLLESLIDKPNSYINDLALAVSVLIASVVLIRVSKRKQHKNDNVLPDLKGNVSMDMMIRVFKSIFLRPKGRVRILAGALTAVIIGIQHGVPFVITVTLSYWNEKMELIGVRPQNLSACGTMGHVTVLCIDATGGLMCKPVEINKFFIGENDIKNDVDSETAQVVVDYLSQGIGVSTLVPEVSVCPTATNDLLISWAKTRLGINIGLLHQSFSVIENRRLRPNKESSWILTKKNGDDGSSLHLHVRGSASTILNLCSHYYDIRGEIHAIDHRRRNFEQMIEEIEDNGLRAVAFACKQTGALEISEDGMHLLAVFGLKYSCQEDIKSTVEALRNAGINIKLISQDELSVVRAIACELGILQPGSNAVMMLEGEQFQDLTTAARMEKMEQITVVGSCSSEDKLLMVQNLQQGGHVVAFFGGLSTSDTPALKEADVGITKRTESTEMTRESSDIVILHGRSLLEVVKFGRCSYYNIQKFTQLQLTACISGLLINLVSAMCSWDSPLTAIQLIWVNFVMCLLGGLMMVMELRSQELIRNQPAKRTQPLVTRVMWQDTAIQVFYQAFVLVILRPAVPSMKEDVWKPFVFSSFMLCQVCNQLNAMNVLSKEVINVGRWFWLSLGVVMVMQVLLVEVVGSVADCAKLDAGRWAFSFIFAALSWGFEHAVKFILIRITRLASWVLNDQA